MQRAFKDIVCRPERACLHHIIPSTRSSSTSPGFGYEWGRLFDPKQVVHQDTVALDLGMQVAGHW
ncbi:MAG TPA: hypothetical protein VLA60_01565 [Nitrospirales bacterium]|nr:hypothetical protein [Nitrospirales bacterium]